MCNNLIKILLLSTTFLLFGCGGGGGGDSDDSENAKSSTEQAQTLFNQALLAEENKEYYLALELYSKSADLGNSSAQNNLGLMYEYGIGTEVDTVKAYELYTKSANQNNVYGQYNLGWAYYEGSGTEQNLSAAFHWLSKAADQQHHDSQAIVAYMYENGESVDVNFEKAYQLYLDSANQGNVFATDSLGRFYQYGIYVSKDMKKAFSYYKESGEQGHTEAQYRLGKIYRSGTLEGEKVTSIDFRVAREWYQKASEQGHSGALNDLGLMLAHGQGGSIDYQAAFEIFLNLAEGQYLTGQLNLAQMYEMGHINGNDFDKAFYWYNEAVKLCQTEQLNGSLCGVAEVALGTLYEKGLGVSINYSTAMNFYLDAVARDHLNGLTSIGKLYLNGLGVEKDVTIAKMYFELAITEHESDPEAQVQLGNLYETGNGVVQDRNKARNLYDMAAEKNHISAYTYIGDFVENYQKMKWYRKAVEGYVYDPRAMLKIAELCSIINYNYCTEDERKTDWYQLASDAGSIDALFHIASTEYDFGYYDMAVESYKKAASRNHTEAALALAKIYSDDPIFKEDPEQAAFYALKSAELGSAEAQLRVALYYFDGYGMPIDYSATLLWLEKAHQQGIRQAATELGKLYEQGYGVTQDHKKAHDYFLEAANQGDHIAQYHIGKMYLQGVGVELDLTQGKAWLIQAASKGNYDAQALVYSPIAAIASHSYSTAVLREDGSVITFGRKNYNQEEVGGNSSSVRERLSSGVTSIHAANDSGFYALKNDGSLIGWGNKNFDSYQAVSESLASGVVSLHHGYLCFAALKEDGSVVTWGDIDNGGDSSQVKQRLQSGVEKIITGEWFMAAIKANGELVVWGDVAQENLPDELSSGVIDVASSSKGAVALKKDGSLVGIPRKGWVNLYPSHVPSDKIGSVKSINSGYKISLINSSNNFVLWDSSDYEMPFKANVVSVHSSNYNDHYQSWLALHADGSLQNWSYKGELFEPVYENSAIKQLLTTASGYAVLRENGSLTSWYNSRNGLYDFQNAPTQNVSSVYSNNANFSAIKTNGDINFWGAELPKNDSRLQVTGNFTKVFPTYSGFFVVDDQNNVIKWGDIDHEEGLDIERLLSSPE
ncbi:hypothetical protein ACQKP3_14670 [Vibrio sp. DNB22_10_4]